MEPEHNLDPVITDESHEERSRILSILVVGGVIVLILFGGLLLLTRSTKPRPTGAAAHLPFDADAAAYAGHISFQNLALSHADNFLNQEFVYVNGTISNDGTRSVRALELTVEFHDPFNQVVLRETGRVIAPPDQPLAAGQQRNFQVTIEQRLPSTWNQQYPSVRITGLVFE
jgi:hypothetical protein